MTGMILRMMPPCTMMRRNPEAMRMIPSATLWYPNLDKMNKGYIAEDADQPNSTRNMHRATMDKAHQRVESGPTASESGFSDANKTGGLRDRTA